MKKLLLITTLLIGMVANAATVTTALTPSAINNVISTNQLLISSVVVQNSTATNGTVYLFDSPRAVLLWTNSAYTSRVTTIGNLTNTYTNVFGTIETNRYTNVIIGGFVTNAGATNAYRSLASIPVPANSSVTYTPEEPLIATFGLTMTNIPNVTVTVTYSNTK